MNIEKITREKKWAFQLKKQTCFFLLFAPLLLSNLITFLFLIYLKQFKSAIRNVIYKSSLNSNSNIITYKENFECWRIDFVVFGDLFFFSS
jgi:hypothetical protein